jgi:transposase
VGRDDLEGVGRDELVDLVLDAHCEKDATQSRLEEAEQQLRWFKQQLFGAKSERRVEGDPAQLSLGEGLARRDGEEAPGQPVREHTRRPRRTKEQSENPGLFFDETVPVERIVVSDPALKGLTEGVDYTVISEKKSYRLAQQPAAYTVLEIVRPVVKLAETGQLAAAPAPASVIPGSYADVSLLAGMLVDKFRYHLPLYRQHQRLAAAGITVSRASLTPWVQRAAALLEPIYDAQLCSILSGSLVAMDETPICAGRAKGKMKTACFWPVYGDRDEVAFPFAPTRARRHAEAILEGFEGTLLTDGYDAYERYAARNEAIVHALCWSHTRRGFVKAEHVEPGRAAEALSRIRALYAIEEELSEKKLDRGSRLAARGQRSKVQVEEFFAWLERELIEAALLPTNPFTKAAHYALERRKGLEVFLTDPDVPLDTNHLERALRPIPMGRKNWIFCWTEVGAEHVGWIQSLISTCVLQDVDPYTYLVDVMQRVDTHPFAQVEQLTPRLWKQHFADAPFRSMLDTGRA